MIISMLLLPTFSYSMLPLLYVFLVEKMGIVSQTSEAVYEVLYKESLTYRIKKYLEVAWKQEFWNQNNKS